MDTTKDGRGPAEPEAEMYHSRNHVYRAYNPNLEAQCIYLYYLKADSDIPIIYFVDKHRRIYRHEMADEIAAILKLRESGDIRPWRSDEWNRMSYFAAVIDHPTVSLEAGNAVTFTHERTGRNHTFRDGKDIPALPDPYSHLSAFFCLNHMKHKQGHVLRENERERFHIHFNHPHRVHPTSSATGHEDSGTNLGPPVPPP